MSNTEIEFNITDTINNNVSSIKIVNDDTIFNLMGKICLVYNITPDFLYVYDDDGPINFKYTNKDIKFNITDTINNNASSIKIVIDKDKIDYNGKSYRQYFYDLSTKLIHSKFKISNKHTLKVVCLLDILNEDILKEKEEEYHGFIKKYWPNIKKEKSIKEYIKLSKSENNKYIKNIKTIDDCNDGQIRNFIDVMKGNTMKNKMKYTDIDIKNKIEKNTGNTDINIIKLFYDLNVDENVPFIKLVLNGYTDSFYKLYEEDIKSNKISRGQYEEWIRGDYIYVNNFMRHKNYTNTLVIVKEVGNEYVSIEISKNGDIHVIIKGLKEIPINDDHIKKIEKNCSGIAGYIKDNIKDKIYGKITNISETAFDNDFEKIEIDLEYNKKKNDLINKEGIQDMFLNKKKIETFFKNNNAYVDLDTLNEDNNIIKLKYKRVDDYFKLDNIQEQIIKLYNDEIKGNEFIADMKKIKTKIKDVIKEQFMIEEEQVGEIVEDMLNDLNKKKRIDKYDNEIFVPTGINPGADIKLYLRPNNEKVKFDITNIKSNYEMKNIIRFLDYFLSEYKKVVKGEVGEVVKDFVEVDKCASKLDQAVNEIEEDKKKDDGVQATQETIGQNTGQLPRMPSLPDSDPESDSDSDSDFDPAEVLRGGAGTLNKRLKEKDKDLFSWKQKDYPNIPVNQQYSKLCQNSHDRLPVVVSNAELQIINDSEELGSGRKSYGKILKVGSTEEKKEDNNYICPIYWDTRKNLSLDPKKFQSEGKKKELEELIKNNDVVKRKHGYWRTAGDDVSKYIPIDTSKLETPWIHPQKYGMPCCFDTRVKEKKEKIVKEIKKSEIINYLKQFPEENFNNDLPKKFRDETQLELKYILNKQLNKVFELKKAPNDVDKGVWDKKQKAKKKEKEDAQLVKIEEGKKMIKKLLTEMNKGDVVKIETYKENINKLLNKNNKIVNIFTKDVENEAKRIILIENDNKDIYEQKNTFGFNQKTYNGIFSLLVSIIDIDYGYGNNIYLKEEKKEFKKKVKEYLEDHKNLNLIPFEKVEKSIDENIKVREDEDIRLIKYNSENIYKINYEFLKYLLKKVGIEEPREGGDYEDFISLLDNGGFKTNTHASIIANKDIWRKTAYGLPNKINEETNGKTIHVLFSKYIDKTPNIKGSHPSSKSVKKYMNDNILNEKDIYFILRQLYDKFKENEILIEKDIKETEKYKKNDKELQIDNGILDKFKDPDFSKNITAYFKYYDEFSDIMAKIYYGADMVGLRSEIQNKFIEHKKNKLIKILKADIVDKLDKNDDILFRKAGGGEIYNAFNIKSSSGTETIKKNYKDYINDDIDHDDKYVLPVIMQLYKNELRKTNFIIFEEYNGSLKIRLPFDLFWGVKDSDTFTLILKNINEYRILYWNYLKKENEIDIEKSKGKTEGYKGLEAILDENNKSKEYLEAFYEGMYERAKKEGVLDAENEDKADVKSYWPKWAYFKGYKEGEERKEAFNDGYDHGIEDIIKEPVDELLKKYGKNKLEGYLEGYEEGNEVYQEKQNGGSDIRPWDNIIKTKDYIIYKAEGDTCSQKWLNEKIDKLYKDIEKIQNSYKDNIPTNIYTYDSKYIEKIKNKKYYINSNNKVSHVIDDKNHFFPIYPCGLNRIADISKDNIKYFKNLKEIPINDDHISFKFLKNCSGIAGYIKDVEGDNVLFGNNTYIRIKANASNIPIIGYIDLFTLDNELGKRTGDEKIEDEEIIKEIDKYYKFKDDLLIEILNDKEKKYIKKPDNKGDEKIKEILKKEKIKKILEKDKNFVNIDKILEEDKDFVNIKKLHKTFEVDYNDKEHLYRFIDLLYKYGRSSYESYETIKKILEEDKIKEILKEDKNFVNIDKIYNTFDKTYQIEEHLYRFIDLLYKYGWPSYDNDNYLEYIYIEPSDLKDNIKEGELYFEYADYEDVDAQTEKERKENSILNKYYNKKNKYYKSLKLYNDNKSDDYDY